MAITNQQNQENQLDDSAVERIEGTNPVMEIAALLLHGRVPDQLPDIIYRDLDSVLISGHVIDGQPLPITRERRIKNLLSLFEVDLTQVQDLHAELTLTKQEILPYLSDFLYYQHLEILQWVHTEFTLTTNDILGCSEQGEREEHSNLFMIAYYHFGITALDWLYDNFPIPEDKQEECVLDIICAIDVRDLVSVERLDWLKAHFELKAWYFHECDWLENLIDDEELEQARWILEQCPLDSSLLQTYVEMHADEHEELADMVRSPDLYSDKEKQEMLITCLFD